MKNTKMKRLVSSAMAIGSIVALSATGFATVNSNYTEKIEVDDTAVFEVLDTSEINIKLFDVETWIDDMNSRRILVNAKLSDEADIIDTIYYSIDDGESYMLQSKVALENEYTEMYGIIPSRHFDEEGIFKLKIWAENSALEKSAVVTKTVIIDETGVNCSDVPLKVSSED